MREAEALLSNEDLGRDLQGVRFLLKKHQVGVWRRERREGVRKSILGVGKISAWNKEVV